MSTSELACTYAALILHDEGVPITADRISKLIKAANVKTVESYWPSLYAKFSEKKDIEELILSVGGSGAVAAAPEAVNATATAGAPAVETPHAEEKKEEVKEESEEEDGLFGLFE